MKKISLATFLIFFSKLLFAQDDALLKDLKCFDQTAFSTLDMMISTRESGGYNMVAEWSEKVSSNQILKKVYSLEGGIQYVILLATVEDADGTGLEIRNHRGEKLEYTYSINDLEKNQITFFYTPPDDDDYRISFRVVNNHRPLSCLYMAILKGDPDPDAQ